MSDLTKRTILSMVFFLYSSLCFAQTEVSGIIWSDTSWDISGNPYVVTGDVQIPFDVTLTIEPGVEIRYSDAYEILVKGTIIAQGTAADTIVFTSLEPEISSNATQIMFEGADLTNSLINYVRMEYADESIRLGRESEHNQRPKNIGTLNISNIKLVNSEIRTDGYRTDAALTITNARINSSTILGEYPRSEPIEVSNAVITNSLIKSESYNYGITVTNSTVRNTQFQIGCCGANIHIINSFVEESTIDDYNNAYIFEISGCHLINTPIDLREAREFSLTNTMFAYDCPFGIRCKNANISHSSIVGSGDGVGLEITGDSASISQTTITQNTAGVIIEITGHADLSYNSFFNNSQYNAANESQQNINAMFCFWGSDDPVEIAEKIYDYYDDINNGIVDHSNFLPTPDINNPIAPPVNVELAINEDHFNIFWSANSETDIAGYKLFYDIDPDHPYEGSGANEGSSPIDLGNVTNFSLTGLDLSTPYFITVSAYDTEADGENDWVEGHESWYAIEASTEALAEIQVSPDSINFGVVNIGDNTIDTFLIENTGIVDLVVDSIISSNNSIFTVDEIGPFTLEPSEAQPIEVDFHPVYIGLFNEQISVYSRAGWEAVYVSGQGAIINIGINPQTLDFSQVWVDSSYTKYFLITNSGSVPISVDSIVSEYDQIFTVSEQTPFIIPPYSSNQAEVTFTPLEALYYEGTITVYSSAGNPSLTVFGTGVNEIFWVWPGDMDNNGIVEAEDVLSLAQYWETSGPARVNIDINWYAHMAMPWDEPEATYTDANGNGLVDFEDFFAIVLNWSLTHGEITHDNPLLDDFDITSNKEILEFIYNRIDEYQSGAQYEIKEFIYNLLNAPPRKFLVKQNYPNPFNNVTEIRYSIFNETDVQIDIYNMLGQHVTTLFKGRQQPGNHAIIWNASNIASGIYFYRTIVGNDASTKQMTLLK